MTTMTTTGLLSRINFTLLALIAALAGMLLFSGCATTDGGDAGHAGHSSGQSSCH